MSWATIKLESAIGDYETNVTLSDHDNESLTEAALDEMYDAAEAWGIKGKVSLDSEDWAFDEKDNFPLPGCTFVCESGGYIGDVHVAVTMYFPSPTRPLRL